MKKLLPLIIMALCLSGAYAQILETTYYFEAGYMPTGTVSNYSVEPNNTLGNDDIYYFVLPRFNTYGGSFRLLFNVEFLLFEHLFVGGRLGTVFSLATDEIYVLEGSPYFMDSTFFIGARFGVFEVGVQRYCNHPVIPSPHAQFITSLDGEVSWGKVYIRIGGKL